MPNWQLALVLTLAIFVGATIPVLIQLWLTLRALRTQMQQLSRPIANIGELAESLTKLRSSIQVASSIGAAVAPVVSAAVEAMRSGSKETNGEVSHGH